MNNSNEKQDKFRVSIFDKIKKINESGIEYWSARGFSELLEYSEFSKFKKVLENAIVSCNNSGYKSLDHFAQVSEMVDIGSGAKRSIIDYHLSRYACYLIVQNADPTKEVVALG